MKDLQDPLSASHSSIPRRIGRGVLTGLAVLLALTIIAVLSNAALIRIFGDSNQWQEWRADNYWALIAWRLTLYIAIATAWIRLKARMSSAKRGQSRRRLRKIEVLFVSLILLIELTKALLQTGGEQ